MACKEDFSASIKKKKLVSACVFGLVHGDVKWWIAMEWFEKAGGMGVGGGGRRFTSLEL